MTEDNKLLSDEERTFRDIAEQIPVVVSELDFNMKFTYSNKKGLDLFGYTREEIAKGLHAFNLFADQNLVRNNFARVLSEEMPGQREYLCKKKDGSELFMQVNSMVIFKDNKPIGMRTFLADITELKKTEQMLKLSEEKFRSIYEESPIGIGIFQQNGSVINLNKSLKRLLYQMKIDCDEKLDLSVISEKLKVSFTNNNNTSGISSLSSIHSQFHFKWYINFINTSEQQQSLIIFQLEDITEKTITEENRIRSAEKNAEDARKTVNFLRRKVLSQNSFNKIITQNHKMKELIRKIDTVADINTNVLIIGESGTGKEVIARTIHETSCRKDKPFVAINCGAIPDTLLESELFGYEPGAFTDAKSQKIGKFELADGGTLFLDEIGDITPAMQVKLLRVLQERVIEPLGSNKYKKIDVRIITATNKNLQALIDNGTFRKDLYYRIKVVQLNIPPLRERRCDIPLLCAYFLEKFSAIYDKDIYSVSDAVLQRLLSYSFPGNIRELENVLEHAFIFCRTLNIELVDLPEEFKSDESLPIVINDESSLKMKVSEEKNIQNALILCKGNITAAAKKLGIHKSTLHRKINKFQTD